MASNMIVAVNPPRVSAAFGEQVAHIYIAKNHSNLWRKSFKSCPLPKNGSDKGFFLNLKNRVSIFTLSIMSRAEIALGRYMTSSKQVTHIYIAKNHSNLWRIFFKLYSRAGLETRLMADAARLNWSPFLSLQRCAETAKNIFSAIHPDFPYPHGLSRKRRGVS